MYLRFQIKLGLTLQTDEVSDVNNDELGFMQLAIDEARKSTSEDERVHPLVGVVVVKNGKYRRHATVVSSRALMPSTSR